MSSETQSEMSQSSDGSESGESDRERGAVISSAATSEPNTATDSDKSGNSKNGASSSEDSGSDSGDESDGESGSAETEVDPETLKDAEKKVANLQDRYEPGARPTVVVPGTGGTVAGTAFADDVEGSGSSDSEESDSSGSDDSGSDAKETDAS